MKEQVLLYGVCAAISVAAVAITSMAKLIVCAIAKRYGKNVSGNVKEYVFTPIALLLAALGNYFWLEKGMELADEEMFVLIIICFSIGTMLVYWLLFQPTRKMATAIIHAIAKKIKAEPIIDAVEGILTETDEPNEERVLQANAKEVETAMGKSPETSSEKTEEDKLRAMVDAIKKAIRKTPDKCPGFFEFGAARGI